MLHLVQSNKMEILLAELLRQLAHKTLVNETAKKSENSLLSILAPETILVQSPGMAQWLKINIANTLQIAANIEFPLPSSYIWRLYKNKDVIHNLPEESAFNKQHLTWKILQLLPGLSETSPFKQIHQYLSHGRQEPYKAGVPSLKTYHLAAKIADIYDQYLMYRPDWIEGWEKGQDEVEGADVSLQPWQPELWRRIKAYTEELDESPWHRANMHDALIKALSEGQFKGAETLYVFGMSTIPLQQLEILQALAQNSDVVIFWFNPTQHFWADVVDNRQFQKQQLSLFDDTAAQTTEPLFQDVGNPLLSSWGKIGRDFHRHLADIDLQQHDLFEAPDSNSLLGWLQDEIFQLSFRGSRKPLTSDALFSNQGEFPKKRISLKDESLEIHITHSVLRELEILRDKICHWFAESKVASLSDIIVMMPDVASYAPLIDAVFSRPLAYGQTNNLNYAEGIPYAISDRSKLQEDAIVDSFIRLMSLHLSRLSLTDIFELIAVPEIASSYQLDEGALGTLREWCVEAGIRWGLNAADKSRFELPEEAQNTWSFGIRRLMAGLAIDSARSEGDCPAVLPFDEVEGQLTTELGKLLAFLEDLENLTTFCSDSHLLETKVDEALTVIECFYLADNQQEYRFQQLKESVARLKAHSKQYTGEINQDTFLAVLKEQLNQSGVGQRFLAGKLNFCTLMPMRSIPFKQVCLLGMNESDYPRQTTPVSFDLMNSATPRKGDRSRRQDDRYLFLEALLSARQKLYISYIGKSDRSNAPLEPSILVNELLQYCLQSVCFEEDANKEYLQSEANIKQHLITEHPLRPWDPHYFNVSQPGSFEQQNLKILQSDIMAGDTHKFFSEEENSADLTDVLPDEEQREITVEHLIQFYRNPVKSWFKYNWKTQFPSLEASSQDEEPLSMSALDNYQLVEALLANDDIDKALERFERAGQLPLANLRFPKETELIGRVEQIGQKILGCIGSGESNQNEISFSSKWCVHTLSIVGTRIDVSGLLPFASNGDLILYRPGKLRAIDRLSLWCHWCLYCSTEEASGRAWFVAENKIVCLEAMPSDVAQRHLKQLINVMLAGEQHCLPFFPEAALTWLESGEKNKTIAAWKGNNFIRGEGQEVHNKRVYPEIESVWKEFTELADIVLSAMVEQETF